MEETKLECPIEIVKIIRPNCLKVDITITLFKSNSGFAPSPAINIVNPETSSKITFNQ